MVSQPLWIDILREKERGGGEERYRGCVNGSRRREEGVEILREGRKGGREGESKRQGKGKGGEWRKKMSRQREREREKERKREVG